MDHDTFRLLAEQSIVGMYVIQGGRYVYVNEGLARMYGYTRDELYELPDFLDIIEPAERVRVREKVARRLSGAVSAETYRSRVVRGDGRAIDIEVHAAAAQRDGKAVVIGSVIDITDRVEAERRVAESEHRYRLLFERNPIPMFVHDAKTEQFVAVNQAALRHYGYSEAEFLQLTPKDLQPEDELARFAETRPTRENGLTHWGVWRHQRRDRGVVFADITAHSLVFGGRDARLVVAQDVTDREFAQEQLRRSEHRFRSLVENALDLVTIFDADGRVLYNSPSLRAMLGYDPAQTIGTNGVEAVHREDREELLAAIRETREHGVGRAPIEARFRHVDGSWRTLECVAFAIEEAHGETHLVANCRDVTERRIAEESLRAIAAQRKRLLETSRSVMTAQTSEALLAQLIESLREVLGFDFCCFYMFNAAIDALQPIVSSGDWTLGQWSIPTGHGISGRVFAAGVPEMVNDAQNDADAFYPPGLQISREHFISVPIRSTTAARGVLNISRASDTPFTEAEFELVQLYAGYASIALENARLFDELRNAVSDWRETFDTVRTPIFLVDEMREVIRANVAGAELLGRSAPLPLQLRDLASREPWVSIDALVRRLDCGDDFISQQVREGGPRVLRPSAGEHEPQAANAGRRTWDVTITALCREGSPTRAVVVVHDVTELVSMQESLRRAETLAAMGNLVAGVAHEVRNPLFGISATLESLEDALLEPHRAVYESYATILREETARLTKLMNELLEYGRPIALDLARCDLRDVLEDAASMCRGIAATNAVKVAIDVASEVSVVMGDRARLAQVFRNLIDNGIRHAPNGRVHVWSERSDRDGARVVDVFVHDSGPGFDPADVDRLFEPFFTKRAGGTGLGLAIVQKIVATHAGAIRATNGPDGGGLMIVTLPAESVGS